MGDMDVDDIPNEILDNLNFRGDEDDNAKITETSKLPNIVFKPLTDDDCKVATLKLIFS